MRSTVLRSLLAALFVVGLLAGCGDDGDGDATPAPDAQDDGAVGPEGEAEAEVDGEGEDAGAGDAPSEGGGAGTVTVDGTQYAIDETRTCDPAEIDVAMVERELELQGLGSAGDDRVQIDVYIEELAGSPSQQVSWSGPEGIYSSTASGVGSGWTDLDANEPLDGPPIEVAGDRVAGEVTMTSATGEGDPITISFDLGVPGEFSVCR